MELSRLLLLLRSQVLPGFHAVEDQLLTLRRQAVEVLQALLQSLLPLWWKPAELRIILQRFPLLLRRKVPLLVKPLACVMPLLRGAGHRVLCRRRVLNRPRYWGCVLCRTLRRPTVIAVVLGKARRDCEHQREAGDRHP